MNREQRRAARRSGAKPAAGPDGAVANLFGAAVAQHQRGALVEAERQYRHILGLFPTHADSLHNLGLIVLQGGNAAFAADLIGRAIKVNERVAEYHYNIALAWRALDRVDQAAAHLERAIGIRTDYAAAHLNLGNVRKEQGRLADAVACYERALASNPKSAPARFNLANTLSAQGRFDAAIAAYGQVVALEPTHAEAHSGLGAALVAQGKSGEAVAHLERAVALNPNLPSACEALGGAYLAEGKLELAIQAASRALELNETAQGKTFFVQCVRAARFTSDDDGRFRKLVLRAMSEAWTRPRNLAAACGSLIKLNGAVSDGIARANSAWPARLAAADLFGSTAMAALSHDQLLCCLLESDPVTDIGLERLLTNMRCAMLTTSATDGAWDASLLEFYCSVARQCFINEYVFSMTEVEAAAAQRLRAALEDALAAGGPCSAHWPVVVGAYFPLHTVSNAQALLERSWPQCVDALIVQQVKEPAEEQRIAAAIPVLTRIEGEVSLAVRQQYEESPYPRWVKAGPPGRPAILNDRAPEQAYDVLIAGCGTGLSTIEFARQARNARILAIDLSRASLGYAKRMAQNLGLTNIEFGQADIMELASIGREFDFIEAGGVLHHLADPWQAWRVLLSLLRPDCAMQVGLYSQLARRDIVAARALIAERGYRPILEDIRRCRADIVAADDPLLQSVTNWADFFATSECRDLLFHVQEHRITLRELKSFLAANDVHFAGFILDASTRQRFATRFPGREAMTDLDCWHAFETDAPGTFAGMYQFWVRKPAAPADATAANAG